MKPDYRIFPLGDSALTVELGNAISVDLNERAIALSEHLQAHPFPGFIETVPAYASTTFFYDIAAVRGAFPESQTAFSAVSEIVEKAISECSTATHAERPLIEIPTDFAADVAPDLASVADFSGLTESQVIDIFTSRTYRVFMLGFLPGFTYMAEVDERIAMPRRDTPRTVVPKGSVGIAGRQTGIYSLASPGGWQIIGRTNVEMFTPSAERPTLLQPGDTVRFVPAR